MMFLKIEAKEHQWIADAYSVFHSCLHENLPTKNRVKDHHPHVTVGPRAATRAIPNSIGY